MFKKNKSGNSPVLYHLDPVCIHIIWKDRNDYNVYIKSIVEAKHGYNITCAYEQRFFCNHDVFTEVLLFYQQIVDITVDMDKRKANLSPQVKRYQVLMFYTLNALGTFKGTVSK